jgi:predicted lipoprotein with Yx(FWY)xxD motif
MRSTLLTIGTIVAAGLIAFGCTSGTGATASPSAQAPTPAPSVAAPSDAPSEAPPASQAAGDTTVELAEVGDHGMVLIASENQMTVYTFTEDTKDSGTSACTGGCLEAWPALTVAEGETPTGGDGITGTLATITREDNGELQVTYNGLPLYFFANDQAPGDSNGVYDKWEIVAP